MTTVVGFALQMVIGALSFPLPVVWGRGAWGNRRLTRLLETGWPARVVALNALDVAWHSSAAVALDPVVAGAQAVKPGAADDRVGQEHDRTGPDCSC